MKRIPEQFAPTWSTYDGAVPLDIQAKKLIQQLNAWKHREVVPDDPSALVGSMLHLVRQLVMGDSPALLENIYEACPDDYRSDFIAEGVLEFAKEDYRHSRPGIPLHPVNCDALPKFIADIPLDDHAQAGYARVFDRVSNSGNTDHLAFLAKLVDRVYRQAGPGHETTALELNGYLHLAILNAKPSVTDLEFDSITNQLTESLRRRPITDFCRAYLEHDRKLPEGGDVWYAFARLASAPDRLKGNNAFVRRAEDEILALATDTSCLDLLILREWLHGEEASKLEQDTGISYKLIDRSPSRKLELQEDWQWRLVEFIAKMKCLGDQWLNKYPIEPMTQKIFEECGPIDFLAADVDMINLINSPIGCVLFNNLPPWLLHIGNVIEQAQKQYEKHQNGKSRTLWLSEKIELIIHLGENEFSRELAKTILPYAMDCMEELKGANCALFNDAPNWLIDVGILEPWLEECQGTDKAQWVMDKIKLIADLGANKLSRTLAKMILKLAIECKAELNAKYHCNWPDLLYEWKDRWERDRVEINSTIHIKSIAGSWALGRFRELKEIIGVVPVAFIDGIEEETINIRELSLTLLRKLGSIKGNSVELIKHGFWSDYSLDAHKNGAFMYVALALWTCSPTELTHAAVLFDQVFGPARDAYVRGSFISSSKHVGYMDMQIFDAYIHNADDIPKEIHPVFLDFVKAYNTVTLTGAYVRDAVLTVSRNCGVLARKKLFSEDDIPLTEIYRVLFQRGHDIRVEELQQVKEWLNIPDSAELMKRITHAYHSNGKKGLEDFFASNPGLPKTRFIETARVLCDF